MGAESQLRRLGGGRKQSKSPPILSHEFIIQNHADIMSCVAMVFIVGLMLKATSPFASMFVTLQHNVTIPGEEVDENASARSFSYAYGLKDIATVFFYSVICIVLHAVLQEYIIDKVKNRLHLSKTKTSKFSESGQLAAFYLVSIVAAGYIISEGEYLTSLKVLWENYPEKHAIMSFLLKLYFIIQLSYWIHTYPEFYFQKVKREEMRFRAMYTTVYLFLIAAAYVLNFTRVAMLMLTLHYTAELLYHVARVAHFTERPSVSRPLWKVWNLAFIAARLGSVILAVLTFWYGLRLSEVSRVDPATGNFNTAFIRLNCLLALCGVQIWLGWNFICAWLRRARERAPAPKRHASSGKSANSKQKRKDAEKEIRSMAEADQDEARQRRH